MKIVANKKFYMNVIAIVIPIALQNLISFGVNMADTVMLGLADKSGTFLSATSLANQPFFILTLFIFGLSGAGAVLGSQYWGKGDLVAIRKIISMVLKIAFCVSFIAMLFILIIPERIMSLYSNNDEIIKAGTEYLNIMGFTYLIFGISSTFICSLRSVEIVRISVVVNLVSFCTNIFLNWVLIFGNLGAPALGIKGAATATLIARFSELVIVLIYVLVIDKKLSFRIRDFLLFDKLLLKDLIYHGSPVVVNEVMWSIGISVQAAILGHITYSAGDPVAANSICGVVQQLATIVIFGLGNAAAVLIGKSIGEGNKEEAQLKSNSFKLIALIFGVIACFVILLLKNVAVDLFDFNYEIKEMAKQMLIVVAINVIFISFSATYIVGILRGAGDTRFCLFAEMISLWGVSIPLALFLAVVIKAPVPIVLLGMRIDEPIKAVLCTIRTKGTKWIKSVTRQ